MKFEDLANVEIEENLTLSWRTKKSNESAVL